MERDRSQTAGAVRSPGPGPAAQSAGLGRGPVEEATPRLNRTANEICRSVRLSRRAQKLLRPETPPGEYLTRLVEHRLYPDAIRYMAHALLNREAVWWACLCARSSVENLETLPAAQQQALGAAVRWVLDPTEANRHAAASTVEAAGIRTSAGAVARAASFALGQSEPSGAGVVPLTPALAARMAAAGILLAGGSSARLSRFITIGLDVAYGENRWD